MNSSERMTGIAHLLAPEHSESQRQQLAAQGYIYTLSTRAFLIMTAAYA
jgi:hypothetical protein